MKEIWTATSNETWQSDYGKIVRSKPQEYYACLSKKLREDNTLKLVNYGPFMSLSCAKIEITKKAQPYLQKRGNKEFA